MAAREVQKMRGGAHESRLQEVSKGEIVNESVRGKAALSCCRKMADSCRATPNDEAKLHKMSARRQLALELHPHVSLIPHPSPRNTRRNGTLEWVGREQHPGSYRNASNPKI